ncbi:chaperone modulator CbpM [Leeuwenhoekiella marinoflava]|uniref:MerR-like DNA binding protein n=2 Tax=Leeuwenhoekiella marinoflava TaxID=988 RepID=A0A4Q0P8Q4_9FLAO|nr:chaperone modulator CbpM [Leeuwenhoekiella marinoflava]RXG23093.1 MerR-like DNA binding protein [Leeuwenhoekiella marinoflava]SHE30336.1 MerR HTH family regulatory protein [Leeuwenhoekiella marinoflava DSM 3653]
MSTPDYIPVLELCEQYHIEHTFFTELHDKGVLEVVTVSQTRCLHHDSIPVFEKIMRIHNELDINIEGIDVILNLLHKIENLNRQLIKTQNRLRIYE